MGPIVHKIIEIKDKWKTRLLELQSFGLDKKDAKLLLTENLEY